MSQSVATERGITVKSGLQKRRLVVCAGRDRCALALEDVVETMRPLAVQPVEGGPEGVRGLAVIRGKPVLVLDLATVLGSPGTCKWTRLVSVRAGERSVALGVAAVEGIREFDDSTLNQMPPLLQRAKPGFVESVCVLDAELFLVLTSARLLPEDACLLVEEG